MKPVRYGNNRKSPHRTGEIPRKSEQQRHLKLVSGRPAPRRYTLLDLVQRVQDTGRDDGEVVATIAQLIESGKVVLGGSFARRPIKPSVDGDSRSTKASEVAAALDAMSVRFAR